MDYKMTFFAIVGASFACMVFLVVCVVFFGDFFFFSFPLTRKEFFTFLMDISTIENCLALKLFFFSISLLLSYFCFKQLIMLVLKARCEREIFLAPSVESQKNLYNTKFIHVFRFFSFNAAFMSIVYPLTNLENRNVLAEKFGKLYRNPGNINYRNLDLLKEDTLTCSTDLFERWAFVLKIFESYSFFCFCFTAICILIYFFCNYSVFTFARNHRRYSRLILFLDYLLIYLPKYALFPVIIQNCMYISE
jgi:hypothetical protein